MVVQQIHELGSRSFFYIDSKFVYEVLNFKYDSFIKH
jgi:hypothetical protein